MGNLKASIGSTDASAGKYLDNGNASSTQTLTDNEIIHMDDDEQVLDNLFGGATIREIYLDKIMFRSAHDGRSEGVYDTHLSKVRKINLKAAEHTFSIT